MVEASKVKSGTDRRQVQTGGAGQDVGRAGLQGATRHRRHARITMGAGQDLGAAAGLGQGQHIIGRFGDVARKRTAAGGNRERGSGIAATNGIVIGDRADPRQRRNGLIKTVQIERCARRQREIGRGRQRIGQPDGKHTLAQIQAAESGRNAKLQGTRATLGQGPGAGDTDRSNGQGAAGLGDIDRTRAGHGDATGERGGADGGVQQGRIIAPDQGDGVADAGAAGGRQIEGCSGVGGVVDDDAA